MKLYEKLSSIQNELVVNKNQRNNFGNYNFRSAEDIMEAAKPICKNHNTVLKVSDTIILVGDRNYVEATATLYDFEGNSIKATASAREALIQKGMADAQITGSTSSYARKYALGGLFNLDDNKDPDATNKHGKDDKKQSSYTPRSKNNPTVNQGARITEYSKEKITKLVQAGKIDLTKLLAHYKIKSVDEMNENDAKYIIKERG